MNTNTTDMVLFDEDTITKTPDTATQEDFDTTEIVPDIDKMEFGGGVATLISEPDTKSEEDTATEPIANIVTIPLEMFTHPKGYKNKKKTSIAKVPLATIPYYQEGDIRKFAIGSPDYLATLADRIKDRPSKISTGIPELDYICGGGWASGLNVLTAAPGTGKTTVLIQSACAMAQQGKAVVYITNDMRELDLTAKVLSQVSYSIAGEECLTIGDILNKGALKNNSPHIQQVMKKTEKTLQYLHIRDLIAVEEFDKACDKDLTLCEMGKIERIFDVYCRTYKDVVFIADSLQQIAGYTSGGKEGVDSQLREFKCLSRKYGCPVIMISTLNRTGYSKMGEIQFQDLKESGSIEYDSDIIVTMVPECMVSSTPDTDLKGFKMSKYRDVRLTCKKSRDTEERDKTMTLFAPGCTFIPKVEEEDKTPTSLGFSPGRMKRKTQTPAKTLPPLGSFNWGDVDA